MELTWNIPFKNLNNSLTNGEIHFYGLFNFKLALFFLSWKIQVPTWICPSLAGKSNFKMDYPILK